MKTPKSCKFLAVAGAILFGALATLPVLAQTYPSQILAQSPIDYWRFNEVTTSPVMNTISNSGSAGAAATGFVVQAVTGETNGIVGNCILFTNAGGNAGECYSRIDIPNLPALNPLPPFSVEIWMKPNPASFTTTWDADGLCPISSDSPFGLAPFSENRSGYRFSIAPGVGGVELLLGGVDGYTAEVDSSSAMSATDWTHVVGEFDGTNAYLYVNGVLSGTAPATGGPYLPNGYVPTRLGGTALDGGEYEDQEYGGGASGEGNRGWDGWLDEFAFYTNILSSNTVMLHYTTATSNPSGYDAVVLASHPVGYWNFDEPAFTNPAPSTYTFAADVGSFLDDGTNTLGTMAGQPGVPGLSSDDHSVLFNGVAGSFVPDTNVLTQNFEGTNLTLVAWINTTSYGFVGDIISQGYSEISYAENFLRVGDVYDWEYFSDNNSYGNYNPALAPATIYYEVGAYDGGPGYVSAVFPAPAGDLGHWVFLAGSFDGTNWNLYRNGDLVAQFSGSFNGDGSPDGPAAVFNNTEYLPWSVGSRANPSPYFGLFYDGAISEAAIFTNALSAETISNLYNSVELPPVITQPPQAPPEAFSGFSTSFSVWADGPGTLAYQWYYNSAALPEQTATNLMLTSLSTALNGVYSVIVTNAFGAATSSVVLVVSTNFSLVPAAETRWIGSPVSFAPSSLPNQPLAFQWFLNGNPISGATQSSYTAPTTSADAGSYTLDFSTNSASVLSSPSTLTLLPVPTNTTYVATILADHPLSYLRLDESNGATIAYDYAGGNNGIYFGNIQLGVPGYSLIDTDTAAYFPGVVNNLVGGIGPTAINFYGTNAEFSIEAWANGPASQIEDAAVIAKGHGSVLTTADEQFAITVQAGLYSFFVRDDKGNEALAQANAGPDGQWHHLVGVCDYQGLGGSRGLTFYIDGVVAATGGLGDLQPSGLVNSQEAVSIGAERSGNLPANDLPYTGAISQVAIYATNLSPAQVSSHYAAAYGPSLAPFITIQPSSTTNYVTLPATLRVDAAGTVPLSYQWNLVGTGPIAGQTSSSMTISNLDYSDAGTYTVGITNTLAGGIVAGVLSVPVTITVLPPPTNPPSIPGLVMHLTFDNTLVDATGRGNNATNEASGGATLITNDYVPGVIGEAFTYQTTTDPTTNANYATVGNRPDLQFGTDTSFTVSMWVQLPPDYIGNDLPFFCDAVGSTFSYPGFCFEPSFGTTVGSTVGWPGGWGFSVYSTSDAGEGVYGDVGTINDGNWHNLTYIIDRVNGAVVYLDGRVSHQNVEGGTTVVGIGNVSTTNIACIGQDPTGLYPQPGSGSIDDLGVWRRALTPLEVGSIYMAAISNQLSFVGPPTITLSLAVQPGPKLQLTWNQGNLQATTNLSGTWTNVVGATSPYTNNPTGTQQFFRVEE
jgi:hypothetical protein